MTVPGLEDFTRGRKMSFINEMEDGTTRTFEFWHNFDMIKNLETQITIKRTTEIEGQSPSKVIRVGGFEKVICQGWIIGPEVETRRNLEAYWYNIMNGPMGRLGTLNIEDNQTIENCVLTNMDVEDSTHIAVRYTLTFLVSLQC